MSSSAHETQVLKTFRRVFFCNILKVRACFLIFWHYPLKGLARINTDKRCIIRLELSLLMRRSRRILKDSSSRRIMRLVPVFILETHNQTSYKCFPKFVQTDNASLI